MSFDPRETGPADLLAGVREWIDDNSTVLIPSVAAVGIVLIVAVGVFDMTIPEIPTWVRVFVAGALVSGLLAFLPAKSLIEWLYQPETVVLVEVDAASGDLAVHELSPDRFSEITVIDHGKQEQPRSFLHKISTKRGLGYECDRYDEENNIAVASWMAGSDNREIRAAEHSIRNIKQKLSLEADRAFDMQVNQESILRSALSEISNRMIQTSQGVRLPDGDLVSDVISEILDRETPDALETTDKQSDDPSQAEDTDDDQAAAQEPNEAPVQGPDRAVADGGSEQ